jgi:SOS-response transcriptional repressor LexA
MLIHNQEHTSNPCISQFAKVRHNDHVDSHSLRLENLLRLIEEAGGIAELARRTGANGTYLSQIKSSKTDRNMGTATARQLEKGMGKPKGWMDLPHSDDEFPSVPLIWVPVLTWCEAASIGTKPPVAGVHESMRKIPTTAVIAGRQLSERCFALRVAGESMVNPAGRPTYPPGCTIIVDPEREAVDGDRVIVKIPHVSEPAFKVYTVDSGRVLLRSLNPQFPSMPWHKGMQVLGVVVQTVIDE